MNIDIFNAIKNKNLLSFQYEGKLRIGEPHILGICNCYFGKRQEKHLQMICQNGVDLMLRK